MCLFQNSFISFSNAILLMFNSFFVSFLFLFIFIWFSKWYDVIGMTSWLRLSQQMKRTNTIVCSLITHMCLSTYIHIVVRIIHIIYCYLSLSLVKKRQQHFQVLHTFSLVSDHFILFFDTRKFNKFLVNTENFLNPLFFCFIVFFLFSHFIPITGHPILHYSSFSLSDFFLLLPAAIGINNSYNMINLPRVH